MASTSKKCCKSIEDPIPSKRFRSSLDAVANITSEASPGSARAEYECCLNNSAHGYQYESDLFSGLFARASMQSINFKMGIEVSAGEKFDDIVFVKEDNNETLLIQIKHFENMKRISSIDLFKSGEKKDFNMGIYFKSFMHTEKNINGQKRYFIFTNKDLDREDVLYWGTFKTRQVDSLIDFTGQGGMYEEFVPKETAIQEMVSKLNTEFDDLKNGLVELFDPRCIFIPDKLQKHKAPLNEIIEITGNYVKYRDNDEKLYEVLDSYYKSKNQDIRCIEKHVNRIRKSDAKGSRDIKTLIMGDRKALKPVFVTEDDVKNFFKQLTFCTKQPENFKNILREEIRIKMRSWIMPDEISKQLKDGTYTAMGKLEAKLDEWQEPIEALVRERKTVPWLTWQDGREVFGMLEKHFSPVRNDFYRSYVNRSLKFAYMSFGCLGSMNVEDYELVLKMNRIFNEQKCLLILGKPGMGKTVFLKHIAYQLQIKYNTWNVFMISLKQLQKNFQNTTKCHTEEFINTLFDSILSEYNIEILTTSSNDNVTRNILLFDGFDEITSTQSMAAIAVLKRLLDFNNIRLIISGRLNVKQILEISFESKAMKLAPLEYDKQVAVLKLNWNVSNDEAKMQKFEIFANKLLEMFHPKILLASCIIDWPSFFTGIPLMAHMLARAYSTRFEKFQKSDKSEIIHDLLAAKNCSMVSLYDQFLRSTFMIKMGKKNECNAYSEIKPFDEEWQTLYEEFIHVHQILAIQQCNIDGINASIDDTRYLQFMERINTGKETSVIINKSDDTTELIHLTYAEYLVALHLYENLHSYRDNLHNILEWNETVRRFVLTIIEENLPRSNAQLTKLIEINSEKSVMTFWACEAACIEIVKALLKSRDITKICFEGYGSLLHEASRVGYYELVIYLIDEYKMNVNYRYIDQTALEYAANSGHLEVVKLLASRSDSSSHKLLFVNPTLLVKESRTEIAKYLIEQNILSEFSCEKLLLATISEHRDLSLIRLLVDRKADIECTDDKGQRPLHVAAKVGYIECVQLLIDRGADINSETKSGMTPLLFAFEIKNHHSRKACVEKLMSCSTIDVKDKNGFTTFHYAAKVGLTELIETLLKFNVDINGQSTFGESPLHIAAKNNQVDFLRKLLEKTETKNGLKDNDGLTALHYAAKHGNPKCVNLLIDFGANVNALTYETRKMPLHSAVDLTYSFRISQVEHVSRLEIVERLLLSGSRIVVDKYGCTALHYAAQNGLVDCLEPLLKKSEDANARSDSGQTPLHLAAKRNHISCVKKLLSVGQPVDEKDENGFTALLSAAYTGSECCMKLLMNAGADVNAQTIEAETALHLASRKKKKKKNLTNV
ncbi:uncharacterized protein LOC110679867 isoform X1 [Aedes aegypti]|uniref:NACHT domain-containing protein n=2 Tax=Aedes aegypti TaxID=7159 RepID=A0A6I8TY06_AEDAE|nr:uncharacterized protein LOC110679867 isoform X1 [Aedes aegypti]XP_021711551.1 uncharacterized protein LOC110679867 isoform X1 [Aedes aegypti]XP_021711552.1 uncharacterized protein LOC110679867 isoform X1 [Aedes aegypti]XP_021711553.1 uncharacterized protein LOC110679867 isoform X1 [Aedes aegypti]XP_021711554.1 uncharacterized protein LOC110679867 isoform X1 [Aedes aegypti]XP_021711555.1 uncharacterized protein LOC110679867 isoform X1 [Aedes aegypti]XP_021711556.1 uncharacterized protein LO